MGREVQDYFKKEGIHHHVTHGETKASIMERFNRTLKTHTYRAFTAKNTLNYLNMFPYLVRGYNHSKHCTIGMPPAEVTSKNEHRV